MRWADERWFAALWLAPIAGVLLLFALRRSRAMARRFMDADLIELLGAPVSAARRGVKAALLLAAGAFLVAALARPQWNARPRELRTAGRDVCFIIDVSRSMLAEDLAPSRLERAKLWMKDVAAALRGDRVALVAFAGVAVVKCPLTNDYAFFRQALEDLSPDSVSRGGTLIGDAIRIAEREVFEQDATHKDIILITDGEDHDSFPVEAAKAAGERGIRIIAVGVGDETTGKPIPVTDERGRPATLMHDGKPVLSRLDGETLRRIALASNDGRYLHVATGTIDLDAVYRQLVAAAEKSERETKDAVRYDEQFQLFLAGAVALLLIEWLTSDRRRAA